MTTLAPVRVLPIPETRPPLVGADEIFPAQVQRYVQDALAIDFANDDDDAFDRQPTPRRSLEDPEPFVVRMAQAFVEVMAGIRPAPQVVRWTSPEVYAVLCRRAIVAARRPPTQQRRAVVRRVRVQEPADGVVEACAVVVHHDRVRALALRMSGLDHRWVVTDLQVV
jgi:hypothetical protein